jgi:hypothetical protein
MSRAVILFWGRVAGFEACHESYKKYLLKPLADAGFSVAGVVLAHNASNITDDTSQFCVVYNVSASKSVICKEDPPFPGFRQSSYYMFRCWEEAVAMAAEYQADLVISLRADILFLTPVASDVFRQAISDPAIAIPSYAAFRTYLTDQMMIGPPELVLGVMSKMLAPEICALYRQHIATRAKMYEPEEHLELALRTLGTPHRILSCDDLLYKLLSKPHNYINDGTIMLLIHKFNPDVALMAYNYISAGVFTDSQTNHIADAITRVGIVSKSSRIVDLVATFRELTDRHNMAILAGVRRLENAP